MTMSLGLFTMSTSRTVILIIFTTLFMCMFIAITVTFRTMTMLVSVLVWLVPVSVVIVTMPMFAVLVSVLVVFMAMSVFMMLVSVLVVFMVMSVFMMLVSVLVVFMMPVPMLVAGVRIAPVSPVGIPIGRIMPVSRTVVCIHGTSITTNGVANNGSGQCTQHGSRGLVIFCDLVTDDTANQATNQNLLRGSLFLVDMGVVSAFVSSERMGAKSQRCDKGKCQYLGFHLDSPVCETSLEYSRCGYRITTVS